MTTELEKQFFDTFGIEKTCNNKTINPANCPINKMRRCCGCDWLDYPQITDKQYLELILIYSEIDRLPICYDTVEHFKEGILECFIEDGEDYKHQVQAIFEGER